jgi:hypothetical protein
MARGSSSDARLLPRNWLGSDDDHAHPCGTGKAISPTSHRSTRLSHQQSAKFNELRQSAARRASDIERPGGIGNESPNKPTNGKTSAHALVGGRCAFASTGSMRGPRSPTRCFFGNGFLASGQLPDHVRPSGLGPFTPNIVPRPDNRTPPQHWTAPGFAGLNDVRKIAPTGIAPLEAPGVLIGSGAFFAWA